MAKLKKAIVRRTTKGIKTSLKIHVVCEGLTESTYLTKLLKRYTNISIYSLDGGGYDKFRTYVERNKNVYKVFIIVADLDKAQPNQTNQKKNNGYKLLNTLIGDIHRLDKLNTIFLTNPDIEYWVACLIGDPSYTFGDLVAMGYEKGDKINSFLKDHNGDFNTAKRIANSHDVYYQKLTPGDNYTLQNQNLELPQSNLSNLLDYINQLNQ